MTDTVAPTRALDEVAINQARQIESTLVVQAQELGIEPERVDVEGIVGNAKAAVVVVGEPNRGKSTLINGLVGIPGLSPTERATTATWMTIRYGPASARVLPDGATIAEEIHLDELPDWITADGLAANPRAPRIPSPVDVTLPVPLLERIDLIDTPGVGGPIAEHDDATFRALEHATAVVFCVDGSHVLSAPEIEFLHEATKRVVHVIFALTKTDQASDWRRLLAENQQIVSARRPALAAAEWVPLAAVLLEDPAMSPAVLEALRSESGIDVLARKLEDDVAPRATALATANVMKALRAVADRLHETAVERMKNISGDDGDRPARIADTRAERARLPNLEDEWRTRLDVDLAGLGRTAQNTVDRRVKAIREQGLAVADQRDGSTAELADVVNGGLAAVVADLQATLASGVDARVRAVVGEHADSPMFLLALADAVASTQEIGLREGTALQATGRIQPGQQYGLATAGVGTLMVSNFAAAPILGSTVVAGLLTSGQILAATIIWPLSVAVVATAVAVKFARRQSRLNERRAWVESRFQEATVDLRALVDHQISTARTVTQRALREWLRRRIADIDATVSELDQQVNQSAREREDAKTMAAKRVHDLKNLIRTCDGQISQLMDRSGTPSGCAQTTDQSE